MAMGRRRSTRGLARTRRAAQLGPRRLVAVRPWQQAAATTAAPTTSSTGDGGSWLRGSTCTAGEGEGAEALGSGRGVVERQNAVAAELGYGGGDAPVVRRAHG